MIPAAILVIILITVVGVLLLWGNAAINELRERQEDWDTDLKYIKKEINELQEEAEKQWVDVSTLKKDKTELGSLAQKLEALGKEVRGIQTRFSGAVPGSVRE